MESKKELRVRLRGRRDALAPDHRRQASLRICAAFLQDPKVGTARRVAIYSAIGSEVDTSGLFARLRAAGVAVFYPRAERDSRTVQFCLVEDVASLRTGAYGILEPAGEAVAVASIDVIAVPGLAFDRQGGRLGYGAGYYDRTLSSYGGRCIGLAFFDQLVDRVPTEDHDRLMDVIITEQGPIEIRREAQSVQPSPEGLPCPT